MVKLQPSFSKIGPPKRHIIDAHRVVRAKGDDIQEARRFPPMTKTKPKRRDPKETALVEPKS